MISIQLEDKVHSRVDSRLNIPRGGRKANLHLIQTSLFDLRFFSFEDMEKENHTLTQYWEARYLLNYFL